MDKASVYGTEDSRFDPWQDRFAPGRARQGAQHMFFFAGEAGRGGQDLLCAPRPEEWKRGSASSGAGVTPKKVAACQHGTALHRLLVACVA